MIKNKRIKTLELYEIGVGYESRVFQYGRGKALKDFRFNNYWQKKNLSILKNKKNKLEILKNLNLPYYPQIFDFYYAVYFDEEVFYAYTMKYLWQKYNGLNLSLLNFRNQLSFYEQIDIIKQVINIIEHLNEQGIYVFDIKLENLFLNINKQLNILDTDNFEVLNYSNDVNTLIMRDFIKQNQITNPVLKQKFAILLLIVDLLFNTQLEGDSLNVMKHFLASHMINPDFFDKADNIISGQDEDINEVVALIKKEDIIRI